MAAEASFHPLLHRVLHEGGSHFSQTYGKSAAIVLVELTFCVFALLVARYSDNLIMVQYIYDNGVLFALAEAKVSQVASGIAL